MMRSASCSAISTRRRCASIAGATSCRSWRRSGCVTTTGNGGRSDRALRDYGATLPNLAIVALPWDRTYVFVTAEAGGSRFDGLEQAVHAEARRAEGGFWWLDLRPCGMATGGQAISPPPTAAPRRILYSRGDPTARDLAGRLAALTHATTAARPPEDLSAAG